MAHWPLTRRIYGFYTITVSFLISWFILCFWLWFHWLWFYWLCFHWLWFYRLWFYRLWFYWLYYECMMTLVMVLSEIYMRVISINESSILHGSSNFNLCNVCKTFTQIKVTHSTTRYYSTRAAFSSGQYTPLFLNKIVSISIWKWVNISVNIVCVI